MEIKAETGYYAQVKLESETRLILLFFLGLARQSY
jgi:hypothetical protein